MKSLDTGLRMEGLFAFTLWDIVIDVLGPTASRQRVTLRFGVHRRVVKVKAGKRTVALAAERHDNSSPLSTNQEQTQSDVG